MLAKLHVARNYFCEKNFQLRGLSERYARSPPECKVRFIAREREDFHARAEV